MSGGGPLIDLGVHVLDLALYLMGEPQVLSASASTFAEHAQQQHFVRGTTGDAVKG